MFAINSNYKSNALFYTERKKISVTLNFASLRCISVLSHVSPCYSNPFYVFVLSIDSFLWKLTFFVQPFWQSVGTLRSWMELPYSAFILRMEPKNLLAARSREGCWSFVAWALQPNAGVNSVKTLPKWEDWHNQLPHTTSIKLQQHLTSCDHNYAPRLISHWRQNLEFVEFLYESVWKTAWFY